MFSIKYFFKNNLKNNLIKNFFKKLNIVFMKLYYCIFIYIKNNFYIKIIFIVLLYIYIIHNINNYEKLLLRILTIKKKNYCKSFFYEI